MDFKNIHIGRMIKMKVAENRIDISRICNFIPADEREIFEMYESPDLNTQILLRWSKLLEYDFFRIYSQHLILYAPPSVSNSSQKPAKAGKSKMPDFRKNLYTQEVIDFVLELVRQGKKTKLQIIEEYNIPKTTLYKWFSKHNNKK